MSAGERWFGSTGRRVPAIVLAGSLDLSEALELDGAADTALLQAAHAAGTPVVVHAGSVTEIAEALARPEVSCVVVADEALLTVDLADHTYG